MTTIVLNKNSIAYQDYHRAEYARWVENAAITGEPRAAATCAENTLLVLPGEALPAEQHPGRSDSTIALVFEVDRDGFFVSPSPLYASDSFSSGASALDAKQVDAITLECDCQHGELSLHADGSFSYMPEPLFVGLDSFVLRHGKDQAIFVQLAVACPMPEQKPAVKPTPKPASTDRVERALSASCERSVTLNFNTKNTASECDLNGATQIPALELVEPVTTLASTEQTAAEDVSSKGEVLETSSDAFIPAELIFGDGMDEESVSYLRQAVSAQDRRSFEAAFSQSDWANRVSRTEQLLLGGGDERRVVQLFREPKLSLSARVVSGMWALSRRWSQRPKRSMRSD